MSLFHLLMIIGIILLIFGPSRLPAAGQSIGEAVRAFKKGLHGDDAIDVTDRSLNSTAQGSQPGSVRDVGDSSGSSRHRQDS